MSSIPYKRRGVDTQGVAFVSDGPVLGPAIEQFYSETGAASSVVTLNDNTTVIEVAAAGTAVAIRWVPTTDTTASVVTATGAGGNFDDVVPAGTVRVFPIPQERIGTSSIVGANKANGLYNRVAWKNFGTGSVIAIEF